MAFLGVILHRSFLKAFAVSFEHRMTAQININFRQLSSCNTIEFVEKEEQIIFFIFLQSVLRLHGKFDKYSKHHSLTMITTWLSDIVSYLLILLRWGEEA